MIFTSHFDHFGPLKVYLRPQFIVLMQTFRLTIACNNSIPKHLLTLTKQLTTLTKTYLQLIIFPYLQLEPYCSSLANVVDLESMHNINSEASVCLQLWHFFFINLTLI